jgi:AcrR family transcriptional regulator
MSRWQPGARERLERAALDLFTEQGFAETTVPQITERAGLTTRTFFRHFADKREVLFAGEEHLPDLVARVTAEAPAELGPLDVIVYGLGKAAETLFTDDRLAFLRARRAVIAADEGLRERELRKLDAVTEAMRGAFRERGADDLTAALAARTGVTIFTTAIGRWIDGNGNPPLPESVKQTLAAFREVTGDEPGGRRGTELARGVRDNDLVLT